jgi:hypothetical protein
MERRPTPVTHEEARQILSRFNASHWRNDGRENARYTIPCDVNRDDDCLLSQYIAEQEAKPSLPPEGHVLLPDGRVCAVRGQGTAADFPIMATTSEPGETVMVLVAESAAKKET